MRKTRRSWLGRGLLLLLAGLLGVLAAQSVARSASNSMAVVVSEPNQAVGSQFDVSIDVTAAGTPYQGYQYKLQWDPAILAFDHQTNLSPSGLTNCTADPIVAGSTVYSVCASSDVTTFTGPVNTVTLHCVANGTGSLHLVTLAEAPGDGTGMVDENAAFIDTGLTDASVNCGGEGPVPTPTPGEGPTATPLPGATPTPGATPAPPGATPTPLPPGFEAVDLAAGCNPVATTYADATPIGTIAAAVGPAGSLEALWEFEGTAWQGYSPAYPEASDLTAKNFLDVVFVCVTGPGAFVRPIV